MRALVAMLAWLMLTAAASAQAVDLRVLDAASPFSGTLTLDASRREEARAIVDLSLDLPVLLDEIDAKGRGRGNLGSDEHRLFWLGPTALLGVEGPSVVLRSRARYEAWIDGWLSRRIGQMTREVDFRVTPVWNDDAKALSIVVDLLDIRDFPGEVEQWLRGLGVDFGGSVELFAVEASALREADLRIEPRSAEALERGLRWRFAASAEARAVSRLIAEAFPDIDPGAALGRLGGWLLGQGG